MKIMELIWESPEGEKVVQSEINIYSESDELALNNLPLEEDYYFREKLYSDRIQARQLADTISELGYDPNDNEF